MEIHYGRKRNGILRELNAKINDWLQTIEDSDVKVIAKNNVIVTGGSICSMLMGDPVNDYDLYFKTKDAAKAIATYYVNKFNSRPNKEQDIVSYTPFVQEKTISNLKSEMEDRICVYMKSAGVAAESQKPYDYFEQRDATDTEAFANSILEDIKDTGEKYRPVFLSQNAITLSHKIQIIIRFYGEPEKIHDNYDFIHAMCYFDFKEGKLVLPAEALEAMLSRTLIYKGSLYPIASIFRVKKFIERGWRITAGQLLKIMWQISEIDLKNPDIFMEQLTGVDQAYMWELISALKNVDAERINSTYVGAIIDKIFE
jgi:hypothetical protein